MHMGEQEIVQVNLFFLGKKTLLVKCKPKKLKHPLIDNTTTT